VKVEVDLDRRRAYRTGAMQAPVSYLHENACSRKLVNSLGSSKTRIDGLGKHKSSGAHLGSDTQHTLCLHSL
jgi:hypothetical protein